MNKFNVGDVVYVFIPGDDASDFDLPIESLSGIAAGKVVGMDPDLPSVYVVEFFDRPEGFDLRGQYLYSDRDEALFKTRKEAENYLQKRVSSALNSNKTKIASHILKIAKELIAGQDEKKQEFKSFKKHIVDVCNAESQKIQELYTWCQLNYNAFTQGIEPFEKLLEIKQQIETFSTNIKNSKMKK